MNPQMGYGLFLLLSLFVTQGYALYSEQNIEQASNNQKYGKSQSDERKREKTLTATWGPTEEPTKTPKKTDTPGPTTPTPTATPTATPSVTPSRTP